MTTAALNPSLTSTSHLHMGPHSPYKLMCHLCIPYLPGRWIFCGCGFGVVCYYQATKEAIQRKLPRVEAGAQGEHDLQAGLLPNFTYSAHYMPDLSCRALCRRSWIGKTLRWAICNLSACDTTAAVCFRQGLMFQLSARHAVVVCLGAW
jgi:hypothetical protein